MAESILFQPDLLYFMLLAAAWIGVLALFMPGTGIIELVVFVGLVYSLGGLIYREANVFGLILVGASFGLYAATLFQSFSSLVGGKNKVETIQPSMLGVAAATVVQIVGGLLLTIFAPGVSWWLVLLLAAVSYAIFHYMLVPTLSALRPPPQSGAEALIGARGEVRTPPADGKPGMVFLDGEYWGAVSATELAVGDKIEVIARDGMQLTVQKADLPGPENSTI